MRFTVTWIDSATEELARIWLDARNKRAVRAAADQIERILRHAPDQAGVEFCGRLLVVVRPLVVTYSVRKDDLLVEVAQVWHV